MARTPAETTPTPVDHQQMNRSNDPAVTAQMDAAAPAVAMASRQGLTGSATGIGSVGFDEPGAFDVSEGREATQIHSTHGRPEGDHPRDDSGLKEAVGSGGIAPSGYPLKDGDEHKMAEGRSFDPMARDPDERRVSGGPIAPPR